MRDLGSCSVPMMELWVVHDSSLHAWRLGYCRMELEINNVIMVQILNGESIMLTDNELVVRIKGLMSRSWDVKISHVRREANMVVVVTC
ncbi:hypothetical protein GQ457_06G018750 [Hibiscus cannabinus]